MKRLRKAGIFFLVMVITLAGIGGAFAAWTDHLAITGTVSTGSVEYEVIGYSGTAVLKPHNSHDIVVIDSNYDGENGWCCVWEPGCEPFNNAAWNSFEGHDLVAYAYAGPGNDGIDMVWWNIFPAGEDFAFSANFEIEYTGTVPARVQSVTTDLPNPATGISVSWTATHMSSPETEWDWEELQNGPGLEKGDRVKVTVTVAANTGPEAMSLGQDSNNPVEGKVTITLTQWNCYQD